MSEPRLLILESKGLLFPLIEGRGPGRVVMEGVKGGDMTPSLLHPSFMLRIMMGSLLLLWAFARLVVGGTRGLSWK